MQKLIIILFLIIAQHHSACIAEDYKGSNTRYVATLLDTISWNKQYEFDRKIDVSYYFSKINGNAFNGLLPEQQSGLNILIKNLIYEQLLKDEDYFYKFTFQRYSKSFTIDELEQLNHYYKTPVMQLVIHERIKNSATKIDEIIKAIKDSNKSQKKIVENFRNSYLSKRYSRFREDFSKEFNKLLFERFKQIVPATLAELPNLVQLAKKNNISEDLTKIK